MKTPLARVALALFFVFVFTFLFAQFSFGQESLSPQNTPDATVDNERNNVAQEAKQAADLDIEQLASLDITVTSASKKSESLNQAPAAIFVLSGEDIRRGGFTSVPDALRMVPGLYVAQEDSHSWIVAARGFSSAFNNKMLVLIDGRLLYEPLFGGVYWDTIDPPLEDIDRIEVIRGPGGTLWGANAVNGVINIITKSGQVTQGESITATYGIDDRYRAGLRYGGDLGPNFSYRVSAQGTYTLASVDSFGTRQANNWNLQQGNMRFDWNLSPRDKLTFEGGGYGGEIGATELNFTWPSANGPLEEQDNIQLKGGDILGRWRHQFSDRASTDVLAYCAWSDRYDILGGDIRNTCDLEFQHDFNFSPRHSVIWGGSILSTVDTTPNTFEISYFPPRRRDTTYSVFGQYELSLIPDKLRVIGGSKFEHNAYTGFEIQPQIRAVWTPTRTSTLWGAVSRAVREPDRLNVGTNLKVSETPSATMPVFEALVGNPLLHSEVVRAYELGYRYQPSRKLSLDTAIFYNHYDRLIIIGPPGVPEILGPYIQVPLPFVNAGRGQTHGLEVAAQVRPISRWGLSAGITELRYATNFSGAQGELTPPHTLNLQSRLDLTRHLNFDSSYYYVDALRELGLPTLNRLDVGVSTKPIGGFTFSLWGRNLQSAHHLENNSALPYFQPGEVRRALVFKLNWQYRPEPQSQKQ